SMLFAGAAPAAAQTNAPSNLLVNPSFEQLGDEITPVPGWTLRAKAAGISSDAIDSISYHGDYSMRVVDDSTATANVTYSDPIEINGGDQLRLRFKAKDTSGTIYVGIRTLKDPSAN